MLGHALKPQTSRTLEPLLFTLPVALTWARVPLVFPQEGTLVRTVDPRITRHGLGLSSLTQQPFDLVSLCFQLVNGADEITQCTKGASAVLISNYVKGEQFLHLDHCDYFLDGIPTQDFPSTAYPLSWS